MPFAPARNRRRAQPPQPRRHLQLSAAALLAAALAVAAGTSHGGEATSTLTVSANVPTRCLITGGTFAFGDYDPVSAHADLPLLGSASITVRCTRGTDATIKLSGGGHSVGTSAAGVPQRHLMGTKGDTLAYALYSDANRQSEWGDTTGTVQHTGTGGDEALWVYGRIDPGQNVRDDDYSDTVTATVTF